MVYSCSVSSNTLGSIYFCYSYPHIKNLLPYLSYDRKSRFLMFSPQVQFFFIWLQRIVEVLSELRGELFGPIAYGFEAVIEVSI